MVTVVVGGVEPVEVELLSMRPGLQHKVLFSHDDVLAHLHPLRRREVLVLDGGAAMPRVLDHFRHVRGEEASVLAVGQGTLPYLGEGHPLHELGGAEQPERAEHGHPPRTLDVEEDEVAEPGDGGGERPEGGVERGVATPARAENSLGRRVFYLLIRC